MDHHVVENAAGDLHVIDGGWFGVTGADLHQIYLAHLAGPDGLVDGPVVVVKAAVKAHLELHSRLFCRVDDLFHPLNPIVHRLLHKHVFPGLGHLNGILRVEVRGGANDNRLDFRVLQNDISVLDDVRDTQPPEELYCLLAHVGVGDGLDLHLGNEFGNVLRVDPANAACPDDANLNGVHMLSLLL